MLQKPNAADGEVARRAAPHLTRSFRDLHDTVVNRKWTGGALLDLVKVACAALLFVSPWAFTFAPVPAWNLWVVAYLMLTCSAAELLAEADWEARTNCCLGAWVLSAPWILGFSADSVATTVHLAGGGCVCFLSAVELCAAKHNPPWRFGPGSALRAAVSTTDLSEPDQPASSGLRSGVEPSAKSTRRRAAVRGSVRIHRPLLMSKPRALWAQGHNGTVNVSRRFSNARRPMEVSRVA